MTDIKTFVPENRLAKMIKLPGGLTLAEAMGRAKRNLESVRDVCLSGLDEKLTSMDCEMESDPSPSPLALARIYQLSNEVFAEAGAFEQHELSAAAHSLCDLVSGDGPGLKSWDGVRVHVAAMRVLRNPALAGDPAQRKAMVAGLQQVSSRAR